MNLDAITLRTQSYGIAGAQNSFGGPTGIWLECTAIGCNESQKLVAPSPDQRKAMMDLSDADVAKVYRRHGWTGKGPRMLQAKCPKCSGKARA